MLPSKKQTKFPYTKLNIVVKYKVIFIKNIPQIKNRLHKKSNYYHPIVHRKYHYQTLTDNIYIHYATLYNKIMDKSIDAITEICWKTTARDIEKTVTKMFSNIKRSEYNNFFIDDLLFCNQKKTAPDEIIAYSNVINSTTTNRTKDGFIKVAKINVQDTQENKKTKNYDQNIDQPNNYLSKEIAQLTILEYKKKKASGQINDKELYEVLQQQIQSTQPLNYIESVNDTKIGAPLSIKSIFWQQNKKCTASSQMLDKFIAPEDSTMVKKLKNIDCNPWIVTNNDEFACGALGINNCNTHIYSPWFINKKPLFVGGSSSGCAASVAVGTALASIGSETGGSVRLPSHFTGLVGYKPSARLLSRHGMIELVAGFDTPAIFAKNVADSRYLFNNLLGTDNKDLTIINYQPITKRKKTIGILRNHNFDRDSQRAIDEATLIFQKKGYEVKDYIIEDISTVIDIYMLLLTTNMLSAYARYNHNFYGNEDTFSNNTEARSALFGKEIKKRITMGAILSKKYKNQHTNILRSTLYKFEKQMNTIFAESDALITMVGPRAPEYDPNYVEDSKTEYIFDTNLCLVNMLGMCAIVVPYGLDNLSKPMGIQLIGARQSDDIILDLAELLDQEWYFYKRYNALGGKYV